MATTYKDFASNDIVNTKTLLYENIPITGSLISGTLYTQTASIKSYSHAMFQSIFDFPATSASANQLFDMTAGVVSGSGGYFTGDSNLTRKVNIYNQMAQVLLGYDATGSILQFDRDGDTATDSADDKYRSCFILNFNRLLVKDEIKKGSFQLTLGIHTSSAQAFNSTCIVGDVSGSDSYRVNSPTGEYGILYATNFSGTNSSTNPNKSVGLIFYQAGVAIISTSIFAASSSDSIVDNLRSNRNGQLINPITMSSTYVGIDNLWRSGSINDINATFRSRIRNLSLNNTTQLNSSIHFCRIGTKDFNYSSNPTYLTQSKIIVKRDDRNNLPQSYITTVGLYSADNQLLAVAKLSQPLKKDPTNEMILRVRLDY